MFSLFTVAVHRDMVMYNRDGSKRGVLETISDFVDSHIRVFRMLPWLMGCTGVLLMYRHSRGILRQFNSISDIPMSVVNGHVPLQGVVRRVSGESVWVWHIPVWRAWSKLPGESVLFNFDIFFILEIR